MRITKTLKNFLENTVINYQAHRIFTNIGVPQGAVTSPTLFNIYIDSLIRKLSDCTMKILAFADDIVFVAKGERQLKEALRQVKNWNNISGIALNKEKSNILRIRADRRTKLEPDLEFDGIKVVDKYKYLGIIVDDCADLKPLN